MCNCCTQKQREPHKPRTAPYVKINAFSSTLPWQFFLTLFLFLAQLILHTIFVIPPLVTEIRHELLIVMLSFHFLLLIFICYDYIYLLNFDPVDRLVVNQELANKYNYSEIRNCALCNTQVKKDSHHCMRCNRCTQQFDHHCLYLNNCIGGQNYEQFIRLLFIDSIYGINVIGQSIWVMIRNFDDPDIAFSGNQWGILTLLIFSVLLFLPVVSLMIFHIYISCCEMTTTFGHMYPSDSGSSKKSKSPDIFVREPQSAEDMVRRNFRQGTNNGNL